MRFSLLWSWPFLVPAALVRALLAILMPQPAPIRKDRLFKLPDGRRIAYEIRGKPAAKNVVFWNHGIISSR